MSSEVWVIATLLSSIVLIVVTIVKGKVHPFLALLLASFYVGTLMGMEPLKMVSAMEAGIGGTLGFLAAVIGLGTILGKMMEVSGAAERIGLALQRCRWLSPDVIMVLVGLVCGITLFVEVGVVLLIPLAFSIARKTNTSLLTLAIPLCTALMASAAAPCCPLCHQSAGRRCGFRHRLWPRGRAVCLAGGRPAVPQAAG
ncbi:hypothetical protein VAWG002_13920 [Aeromonas veronii]|nr:hypothetical protein VAWG002_13920 [Aeromonas veronii]